MEWIKNLKIAQKLYVLIGLGVIFVALVAVVGFISTNKGASDMTALYKDRLLPINQLGDIRANVEAIRGNMYALTVTTDANQNKVLFDENTELKKENNENLTAYEASKLDPFEVDNLKKFKEDLVTYRAVQKVVVDCDCGVSPASHGIR